MWMIKSLLMANYLALLTSLSCVWLPSLTKPPWGPGLLSEVRFPESLVVETMRLFTLSISYSQCHCKPSVTVDDEVRPVSSSSQGFHIAVVFSFHLSYSTTEIYCFPELRQMDTHRRPHTRIRITALWAWALYQRCLLRLVSRKLSREVRSGYCLHVWHITFGSSATRNWLL